MSRAVRYKKHLTTLQVFLSIVLILLTACVAVKAFFLKAPEQKAAELPSQPSSTGDPQLSEEEQAAQKALRSHLERKGGFYTILVSGSDDGNGNSDTNILVAVDTVNGYVYGVSIPRDSKAVWDGKSHKINAAFGKGGMTKLAEVVSDQLGIPVDYTVSVDLTGFEALVEAIGGVHFEVPFDMDYDDPTPGQDLHIHLKQGYQELNGEQAMGLIRWRHNNDYSVQYPNGDLGRVQTQQAFLKAVAAECLKPEILLKVTSLAEIFMENVSTDLSLGNLLAFAQLAMGMDAEKDIQFITMPNQDARYPRVSMVLPVVDELLAALNSGFDPYVDQIRASDLQVLVRNSDGSYSVTGGTLLDETLSRPRGSGSSSGGGQTAETPEEPEEELPDPDGSQELPPDGSQVIPPDGSGTLPPNGSQELPPDGSQGDQTVPPSESGGDSGLPETGGSQDAGSGETGEQPEPPAEGGSSAGGTEGGEGLTVSELPDWLNPTGLEPAA